VTGGTNSGQERAQQSCACVMAACMAAFLPSKGVAAACGWRRRLLCSRLYPTCLRG
jgi:hypothetical protein